MLSDFLDVLLALALSPLVLWLALVGLLVYAGTLIRVGLRARALTSSPSRPADGEPYDWQRHGL